MNEYRVEGGVVFMEVLDKSNRIAREPFFDLTDLDMVQGYPSPSTSGPSRTWGINKTGVSIETNYREKDTGKMKKITLHKLISGSTFVQWRDGNPDNFCLENLKPCESGTRNRKQGLLVKGNFFESLQDGVYLDIKNKSGVVVVRAIVDHDDMERVLKYTWNLNGVHGYIQTRYSERKNVVRGMYLHRFIIDAEPGETVDHINRVRHDCRKSNLRICTPSENSHNAFRSNNTSGAKGVSYSPRKGRKKPWSAQIVVEGSRFHKEFHTYAEALSQRQTWEAEYEPSGLEE